MKLTGVNLPMKIETKSGDIEMTATLSQDEAFTLYCATRNGKRTHVQRALLVNLGNLLDESLGGALSAKLAGMEKSIGLHDESRNQEQDEEQEAGQGGGEDERQEHSDD